jgi:hypothetical protein
VFIAGDDVAVAGGFSAVEGNGDVERDAVHPGGELAAAVEGFIRPPKLDQNLLREVVPGIWIPAIGVADLVKDLAVLFNPGFEVAHTLSYRDSRYEAQKAQAGGKV